MIVGLLLVVFIPGFLLTMILFRNISLIERVLLAIGLSFLLDIFLGFLLNGFNAINKLGIYLGLGLISLIFLLILVLEKKIALVE